MMAFKNHYDTLSTQRKRTADPRLRAALPAPMMGKIVRFRRAEPYNRLSAHEIVDGRLRDFHVAVFHWYRWNVDVRCIYCSVPLESGKNLTRDHVHPRSKGGPTTQANLEPACPRCNGRKADKKLLVYLFENQAAAAAAH